MTIGLRYAVVLATAIMLRALYATFIDLLFLRISYWKCKLVLEDQVQTDLYTNFAIFIIKTS